MSWIKDFEYKGIKFQFFGDWFGPDGFKICLPIGQEEVVKAIFERGDDVLDGLRYFSQNAEEFMLVGWANDSNFWWHMERDVSAEEYKRIAIIIYESEFANDSAKQEARETLNSIAERERKEIEKEAKRQITQRRRSDFAVKYDQHLLALIERDGYQCSECGDTEDLTIDHIIPISKGGSDDLDNLRLLCRGHNSSKGDRMPEG